MICLICRQSELINGFTSIALARGEFRLLVKHVPAHVCPKCGEALVDEDAAAQLLGKAQDMFDQGIREAVCEY
jgi:YgiT-type zinc finger domain-containing protein